MSIQFFWSRAKESIFPKHLWYFYQFPKKNQNSSYLNMSLVKMGHVLLKWKNVPPDSYLCIVHGKLPEN